MRIIGFALLARGILAGKSAGGPAFCGIIPSANKIFRFGGRNLAKQFSKKNF
jgi:hypothetical protein